jgi:hypothetical protein
VATWGVTISSAGLDALWLRTGLARVWPESQMIDNQAVVEPRGASQFAENVRQC